MCINRPKILLFSIVGILCLVAFRADRKAGDPVILRDEKLNFVPKEFYIEGVTDERTDQSSVASLVSPVEAHSDVIRPADIKGGAANGIKLFIGRNLQQNPTLRPVVITLKELRITETTQGGGRVSGHLAMAISFGLQKNYGALNLVEYTGGTRYTRGSTQTEVPETILRHGIMDALAWFNNWINKYADSDARLAKSVSVKFSDYTEQPEGDTIYYSAKRPLTWADFKDKPKAGAFDAEIFASIGYTEMARVENGVIKLELAIKVDMPKSGSWVRQGALDDYALNHEQRHFDIAKIIGERFKRKIMAMELPSDNYMGPINMEYLETLRELTAMQMQYDRETRHGNDRFGQGLWNEKIDQELKSFGVK